MIIPNFSSAFYRLSLEVWIESKLLLNLHRSAGVPPGWLRKNPYPPDADNADEGRHSKHLNSVPSADGISPNHLAEGMKNKNNTYCLEGSIPSVLVISATDSAGCAGMMADLRVCAAMKVYPSCAVTAVTAQNSLGIKGGMPVSPELLSQQIQCAVGQQKPNAVKIGLLPNASLIRALTHSITDSGLPDIVLDTVGGATAGRMFDCGTESWREAVLKLLPLCTIVTPNIPELRMLADMEVKDTMSIFNAAHKMQNDYGVRYLLVKGGHGASADSCVDYLFRPDKGTPLTFTAQKIETVNLRGTGCTLSTAIACYLAKGLNLEEAVFKAHLYMQEAIRAGREHCYCGGRGPVEHFPEYD